MRRKEREITDFKKIEAILKKADFLTLALLDEKKPYCVPLNFGFQSEEEKFVIFVHGAAEGKKIECVKNCAEVSFCAVGFCEVSSGKTPCAWTDFYESVCGSGTAKIVEDANEKQIALECVLKKYGFSEESASFPGKMLEKTCVIKIEVKQISGKTHAYSKR